MEEAVPEEFDEVNHALNAWSALAGAEFERLGGGLINQSWRVVTRGGEHIAQRVHADFSPGIHTNIQAVSSHLAERGIAVSRLVETDAGDLFSDLGAGGRWRVMKRIPGVSFPKCSSPDQARSAGALVARFHGGMMDWRGDLEPIGFPFHDMPRHISDLLHALEKHADHPRVSEVQALANKILDVQQSWAIPSPLPRRVVHGDLKLSNLLFEGAEPPASEAACALIDLDTISRLPLYYDLGDAWRSWCNVGGEGPLDVRLDLEIFRASAEGYLAGLSIQLSEVEKGSLVEALERVSLELCARFAADALEETHFAWDARAFPTAAEHNLFRAQGQMSLHDQARESRSERARFLLG